MLNPEERSNRKRIFAASVFVVLTAFLMGEFAIVIFTGMAVFMFVFMLIRAVSPAHLGLGSRLINFGRFVIDFVIDLLMSNLRLAMDVFTPKDYHRSQLVSVPISDLTPWEVAIISHRITLTPGTLSCVITEDRRTLIVHSMYTFDQANPGKALRRPIDILKGTA